ncbi:hypothetical protein ACM66B_004214 [Microbotryomycetes sp. NB124-2]
MDAARPAKKRKTLPKLDDDFFEQPRSSDSPELHHGRKRTVPHQQGQWAAHVFVELVPDDALRKALCKAVKDASSGLKDSATVVHSFLQQSPSDGDERKAADDTVLHMSLSRPLMLQTNTRSDLKAAVATVAHSSKPVSCRFASFDWLENDDKTRRFLAVEVGAGHPELKTLVRLIDDHLDRLRLPRYYETPRFHCSLAWSVTTTANTSTDSCLPFDDDVIKALNDKYDSVLSQEPMTASSLCVKIGKVVTRYRLAAYSSAGAQTYDVNMLQ